MAAYNEVTEEHQEPTWKETGHARPVCRHPERPHRLYDNSMEPGSHHNHKLFHEKSISKTPIFINFII
jgi:hypothetical protein